MDSREPQDHYIVHGQMNGYELMDNYHKQKIF